jgi:integrase
LLSRFFAWAIERGHAEVNPVRMIPQGKRPQGAQKSDGPWLQDEAQFRALFAALPEPVNLIFWLGYRSGMRPGEAAGVTLGDFAWLHEGVIRVGHSYGGPLKEDRRAVGKVKWVPASADAGAVIGPWLERRRAEGATDSDLVFPYRGGSDRPRRTGWAGYKKEHLQSLWEAARAAVGIELTIYQATRHSFVSRHLSAGVPLEEVSAAIGHAQVTTTRRFYDHYVRRSYSDAIRGVATGSTPPAAG